MQKGESMETKSLEEAPDRDVSSDSDSDNEADDNRKPAYVTEVREPKNLAEMYASKLAAALQRPEPKVNPPSDPRGRLWRDSRSEMGHTLPALYGRLEKQRRDYEALSNRYDDLHSSGCGLLRQFQHIVNSLERYKEMHSFEKEQREKFQEQIVELKQGLSSIGRAHGQVSSDFLIAETRQLAHNTQNWVVNNTRKLKLVDLENLSTETKRALSKAFPMLPRAASPSKLHILQALIAQMMMTIFNSETLLLEEHEKAAVTLCQKLNASTSDKSRFNQWRSMTFSMLYNIPDEELENLTRDLLERQAAAVEEVFSEILDVPFSTERVKSLQRILFAAVKLSRSIRTQRMCLRFEMPAVPKFSAECMQDVNGQESADLEGETLGAVLFPLLVKYGNDNGDNMNIATVLSKARVLCLKEIMEDEEEKEEEKILEEGLVGKFD